MDRSLSFARNVRAVIISSDGEDIIGGPRIGESLFSRFGNVAISAI